MSRVISGPLRRSRMAKPNEELESGRNLQNQGRLRLSSSRARPVLMGNLLLQHSSSADRQTPPGLAVVLLVAILPVVLAPSSSCTTPPYAPAGPSPSTAPTAPAPTDVDREILLSQHGTASPSAPKGACHTVRPETATVPTPAPTGRQNITPLDSDPSVSSHPESLRGALTAAITSFGPSVSARSSFPHPSQGSPSHLRSVVLRI